VSNDDILIDHAILRPNFKIISSAKEPVYISDITLSNSASKGLFYTLSTPALNTLAKGYLALQLTNPSTSTKNVYLMQASGYTTALSSSSSNYIQADIYANASLNSTATSLTTHNTNFGSSNTSECTAGYLVKSTTPLSGSPTSIATLIQNTGASIIINLGGSYIVPPGYNFTIVIFNNTSNQSTTALGLLWLEL